jgi:hypothetical protein
LAKRIQSGLTRCSAISPAKTVPVATVNNGIRFTEESGAARTELADEYLASQD